jgi:hypothetical protein
MFKSKGIIRYGDNSWWITVKTCETITDYYRWFVSKHVHYCVSGSRHGSHITVNRGELEPFNKEIWKKYNGQEAEFYYHTLEHNKVYAWLKVESEFLSHIRHELGLGPKTNGFHLTVARIQNPYKFPGISKEL